VARRPEVASREKNPAAAGIRRFFPLSNKEPKEKISFFIRDDEGRPKKKTIHVQILYF